MGTRRLFLSIDLPEDLCSGVADVQDTFRELPGVRLPDPDQSHVTLKFLGEVPENRVETVADIATEAAAAADVAPFAASVAGLGVFPSFDYISVVWLGVEDGATSMTKLHRACEDRFVEAGFEAEDHEYRPHVTIARVDHGGAKERIHALVGDNDPTVGSFRVEAIALTESTLTADGPVYDTVDEIALD